MNRMEGGRDRDIEEGTGKVVVNDIPFHYKSLKTEIVVLIFQSLFIPILYDWVYKFFFIRVFLFFQETIIMNQNTFNCFYGVLY